MGRALLFKETFDDDRRPNGFAPMLRPTRRNFDEFVQLLDKMLSENLNRVFFEGEDSILEDRLTGKDGTVERRRIGTLVALERWLREHYRTKDGEDASREILKPFREVRELRQRPAHALQGDEYNLSFPKSQDELLGRLVLGLRTLRYVFMAHPAAREYSAPEWLDSDKIVFY